MTFTIYDASARQILNINNYLMTDNKNEFYEINFISEDKTFNGKKIFKKGISVIENEQKNQFDQNVQ